KFKRESLPADVNDFLNKISFKKRSTFPINEFNYLLNKYSDIFIVDLLHKYRWEWLKKRKSEKEECNYRDSVIAVGIKNYILNHPNDKIIIWYSNFHITNKPNLQSNDREFNNLNYWLKKYNINFFSVGTNCINYKNRDKMFKNVSSNLYENLDLDK